jgi:hypothetical protein
MDSAVRDDDSSSPNDKNFPESADEVRARNDEFRAFFCASMIAVEKSAPSSSTMLTAGGRPLRGKQERWNHLGKVRILC